MNIKLKQISKKYRQNNYALKDVDIELNESEIVAIIGPNGAGKTTIMKILGGLIVNYTGEKNINPDNLSAFGNLIENPKYFPNQTGYYNLKYFAKLRKKNIKDFYTVINSLGLDNYLSKKVKYYSMGMKQRLSVAIAIICSSQLLILDEPTNGMDPNGKKDFLQFIKELSSNSNMLILISSHNLEEISEVADKIYLMKNGKMIDSFTNTSTTFIEIRLNNYEYNIAKDLLKEFDDIEFFENKIKLKNKENLKNVLKILSSKNIFPENVSEKKTNLKDIYFSKTGGN
ncbi:ABC transporter ATP-binding protein [Staphylococcus epidermidis]|uniref:ATP-binding cassette domain-containing protein n=1 Tax=Staphylococcus epidermidis TaxID=1282 RepID=UPI00138B08F0